MSQKARKFLAVCGCIGIMVGGVIAAGYADDGEAVDKQKAEAIAAHALEMEKNPTNYPACTICHVNNEAPSATTAPDSAKDRATS